MFTKVSKGVCAPKGFYASGIHCGIRKNKEKKDLALIYSDSPCSAASVYTQNKVCGAPIKVSRRHLADGSARAILCNSGNANTCNPNGEEIAEKMCALCGAELGIAKEEIIVASTGVIGQPLAIEPIQSGMPALVKALDTEGSAAAASAMMTTDTRLKESAVSFYLGSKLCHIGGIAKGSGMIHPNMATMLAFVSSDAAISSPLLAKMLKEVADETFNMISVDGDTSTNDMFSMLCNGQAGNVCITEENEDYGVMKAALYQVAEELARMMAADGEGATKLLCCEVSGAKSKEDAGKVAKAVISSTLFKCAMFGKDANWGRILCALGYCGADLNPERIKVFLAAGGKKLQVCENGHAVQDVEGGSGFDEKKALDILGQEQIHILIDLQEGSAHAKAWGCDLSYDYVKINGAYRS